MEELSRAISALLPDLVSEKRFVSPERRANISSQADIILRLAHPVRGDDRLTQLQSATGAEPGLGVVSSLLGETAQRAHEALQKGRTEYTQRALRATVGECASCHGQPIAKGHIPALAYNMDLTELTPLERADVFLATQRFGQANTELMGIITTLDAAREQSRDWQQAVRRALAIAVAVQKDPRAAHKLVARVIQTPAAATLQKSAVIWGDSLAQWQFEHEEDALLPAELLQKLLTHARIHHFGPRDYAADVDYLRAIVGINRALITTPHGSDRAQMLLMLGECYEHLSGIPMWPMYETFYEACVLEAPHTELARTCFARFKKSTVQDFPERPKGTLPGDVQARLLGLEGLTTTTTTTPNP